MRGKQTYLPGLERSNVKAFGGILIKGNPREARPISIKRPMHLVMRSKHATGDLSFLHSSRVRKIEELVQRLARQKNVKVYRFANSGNHLHLIILPRSLHAFKAYIRALSGLIARITLGAERGKSRSDFSPARLNKKFWDARPFTRIIEWGKEFKTVVSYVAQNKLEAMGFIPYQKRSGRFSKAALDST